LSTLGDFKMEYIKARLKEPSTWVSLVSLGAAYNLYTADQSQAIIAVVLALSGVQGAVTKA
jgi:hypothetical protein